MTRLFAATLACVSLPVSADTALLPGQGDATDAAARIVGRSGKTIYGSSCAGCHNRGMRGAPRATDTAAWAPRLAQGRDMLYRHTIKGFGWMPTRGGCTTCSDDEVKAAVDHLLSLVPPAP